VVCLAPDNAQAWKQLSYLYLKADERRMALEAVERALRFTPDDLQTAMQRAFLLRSLGRTDEATNAFTDIARTSSQPFSGQATEALERLGGQSDPVYGALDRAYTALAAGNFDQAIVGFQDALAVDPNRPKIEKELAYTLLKAGESPAARDAFERGVRLDPSDERAELELAFLQHETGQPAKALAHFRILSRSRDDSIATLAGETADRLEAELGAAINRWVRALEQDPDNRSVRLELGDFYEKRNQPVEAAQQYLEGWRLPGPDGDEVLLKLGHARMRARDTEGAHGSWLLAAQSEETRIAETALALLPDCFPWSDEFHAADLLAQAQESDDPEVANRARLQLRSYREERSRSLREMGDKSLKQSYLLDAQKQFAEAYSTNPEDYAAALKLGVVYNLMKRDREAVD
jgi:tetratricopeptide (TPR) repeat protein